MSEGDADDDVAACAAAASSGEAPEASVGDSLGDAPNGIIFLADADAHGLLWLLVMRATEPARRPREPDGGTRRVS